MRMNEAIVIAATVTLAACGSRPRGRPTPIITNGKLILRNQEHMYAYDVRAAKGQLTATSTP